MFVGYVRPRKRPLEDLLYTSYLRKITREGV